MANSTGGLTQQQLLQSIAPQTAGDALQEAATQQQIDLIGPTTAAEVGYSNALAGIQSSQYGITQQQNQLQQTENSQQIAQNSTQQGIEQQNYGLSQANIGLQGQQLGVQQQQSTLAYNNALTGQQDAGAASGTTNTRGQKNAISTLGQNYALGNQSLGIQNSELFNQLQSAQNTQIGEQSGYEFNQQQLGNAQTNLGLVAQSNGLSNQQALTMLNYQNQQAGLQGQQQGAQLLGQLGSEESSDAQTIGQTLALQGFAGGKSTQK